MSSTANVIDYQLRPVGAITLYNGSDERVEWTVSAKDFRIEPRGTLVIEDIRVHPDSVAINARHVGQAKIMRAIDVVTFSIGDDGVSGVVGRRGVRRLFGDERDEVVVAEAKSTAGRTKYDMACAEIRTHEAAVQKARDHSAPPPPPSKRVQEAYLYRTQYQQNNGQVTYPFQCDTCAWGFRTEDELIGHKGAAHREAASGAPAQGDTSSLVAAIQAQGQAQIDAIRAMGETQARILAEAIGAAMAGRAPEAGGRGGKRKRRRAAEQPAPPATNEGAE